MQDRSHRDSGPVDVDDVEAADEFLRFGVGPVGNPEVIAVGTPDDSLCTGLEDTSEDPDAGVFELVRAAIRFRASSRSVAGRSSSVRR
jgi:hypothetical protein